MCLDQLSSDQEVVDIIENFIGRLRQGVYMKEDDRPIPISCSIGVAVISSLQETTYDKIVEMADQAMYKVKNSTKNGYHIDK